MVVRTAVVAAPVFKKVRREMDWDGMMEGRVARVCRQGKEVRSVTFECRRSGGWPIGDAAITAGGNLKARHVIHAVGPVWRGGDEDEPKLLASAYRRSLQVAVQHGLHSISFPSISTGAFIYPLRLAAPIALKTIIEFLEREQHNLDEVRMV